MDDRGARVLRVPGCDPGLLVGVDDDGVGAHVVEQLGERAGARREGAQLADAVERAAERLDEQRHGVHDRDERVRAGRRHAAPVPVCGFAAR